MTMTGTQAGTAQGRVVILIIITQRKVGNQATITIIITPEKVESRGTKRGNPAKSAPTAHVPLEKDQGRKEGNQDRRRRPVGVSVAMAMT